MNSKYYKCKYNTRNFCYAPETCKTDKTQQGKCQPILCPERERQILAKG